MIHSHVSTDCVECKQSSSCLLNKSCTSNCNFVFNNMGFIYIFYDYKNLIRYLGLFFSS